MTLYDYLNDPDFDPGEDAIRRAMSGVLCRCTGYVHIVEAVREAAQRLAGANAKYEMAGKSGTAQVFSVAQEEEYDEELVDELLRDHALFVAFAPLQDPRIAVAVIVENGSSGSRVAAPIARQIMDEYLGYGSHGAQ
jgi:penicillin-binding protein 2